jgi:hypothetical protein
MKAHFLFALALLAFANGNALSQQMDAKGNKASPIITPADLPSPRLFFNNETRGIIVRSIKDFPEPSRIKFEAKFKAEATLAKSSSAATGSVTVWDHGVDVNDGPRRIAKATAEAVKRGKFKGSSELEYSFKFSNVDNSAMANLQFLGMIASGDPSRSPLTSAIRVFIDNKGTIFALQEDDFSVTAGGSAMAIKELLAVDVGGKLGQLVKIRNAKGDETWLLNWIHKERTINLTVSCDTGACINAEEMLKIGTSIVSPD